MAFGWKYLIPISLGWIVAVATVRSVLLEGGVDRQYFLMGVGVLAAVFLVLMFFGGDAEDAGDRADEAPADPFAGGYPVPPMPSGGPVRGAASPLTFDSGSTVHRSTHERGTDG
jgi:NADH-quinone oxidoreductase subunit H